MSGAESASVSMDSTDEEHAALGDGSEGSQESYGPPLGQLTGF